MLMPINRFALDTELELAPAIRELKTVNWPKVGMRLLSTFILFALGLICIRLLTRGLERMLNRAKIRRGAHRLVTSLLKFLLYFILLILCVDRLGFATSSLIAILGSMGIAIGLALQGSLGDLASGILIVVLNPFQTGDYVYLGEKREELLQVVELRLFQTHFRNMRGFRVIVPNSQLTKNAIVNISVEHTVMAEAKFVVGFDSNFETVKKVVDAAMDRVPEISTEDRRLILNELGESGIHFTARGRVAAADYFKASNDLLAELKTSLDAAGIVIPYPQMVIHQAKE